ncbi:LOW QUALITY PROTEIN: hypothetical protein Ct61P_03194 [Colletotrichum tofieldiae]|nr:LOW QUALITY PROTEIN: hypothetical protein Ct61P_03194 [Colletotrichum tofieldiae]
MTKVVDDDTILIGPSGVSVRNITVGGPKAKTSDTAYEIAGGATITQAGASVTARASPSGRGGDHDKDYWRRDHHDWAIWRCGLDPHASVPVWPDSGYENRYSDDGSGSAAGVVRDK